MEQKAKKPSLFKQRLAASKPDANKNGFPEVIKLDLNINKEPIIDQKNIMPSKAEQKGLIDMIKKQSIIKEDDLKKIQNQNWEKIKAMSEEERQNMINLIHTEMKPDFIAKIRKQKKIMDQPKKQPPAQQKPKQPQQSQQDDESWYFLLKIDIQTNKLSYSQQQRQNVISIGQIAEMIGSENNQSQIIGSKIAAKFVDLLIQLTTDKTRELVIVNHVPLHLSIIFQRLSFDLFETMVRKAKNTLFISAFIQITVKISQILVKVGKYLSKQWKEKIHQGLKGLLVKSNTFRMDKENIATIISSLQLLCKTYSQYENKVQNENWQNMKQNADIFLELILLEQAQPYTNSYSVNIYQLINKSTDLAEIVSVEQFVYEIINKLILRRNKELYINIQSFRVHWRPIIENIVERLIPKIVNIELQCIFQLIFLARFAGQASWDKIIIYLQHLTQIKPMVPHFVLFNTLSDQKEGLRQQNIQSLNSVFNWLANSISLGRINPNYILNTLTQLFLHQDEYYSELDQSILQKLTTSLFTNKKLALNIVITQQKIRSLIKNYGFNSFGNQVFSNFLLLLAMKSEPHLQSMLLRQVVSKYCNNFMNASKNLQRDIQIFSSKGSQQNRQLKNEILSSIDGQESGENLFIMYLSS